MIPEKTLYQLFIFPLLFLPSFLAYREHSPSDLKVPPSGYYISNPDSLLSYSDFESINKELKSFEKLQVGVLIIEKMSSAFLNQYNNQDNAAHEFAKMVFDQWGIGDRSTNNGLLIFISIRDRKLRIVTGIGARELVSDSSATDIFNEVKYLLKNDDYAGAIRGSLSEIRDYINPNIFNQIAKTISALIIPIIFIGMVCCFVCFQRTRPEYRNRANFTSNIEKLKEMQKKGRLNEHFINGTCGICLEDFEKNEKENPKAAEFVILVCGHNFHKNCLETWLKKKNMCPFCKLKDPTNTNRDPFKTNNDEYEKLQEDEPVESANGNNDIYILQRMILIQRLRYPQFYNDYSFSYGSNSFNYRDVRVQPSSNYRGSSSTSFGSFGGGSSGGGGGGGGSW